MDISSNEYHVALRKAESYYLYVIENLDGRPTLHETDNPAGRVTHSSFDNSWLKTETDAAD